MNRVEPHPVSCIADVKETVNFIKKPVLEGMNDAWPRNQECERSSFAVPQKEDLVLAVSHCWVYSAHPDPGCLKMDPLNQLLQQAVAAHKPQNNTLVFIDFLSVSQRPVRASEPDRTPEQEKAFALALRAFPQIYLQADAVLHVDVEPRQLPGDLAAYSVSLDDLEGVTLMQRGSNLHIVKMPPDSPYPVRLYDAVDAVGGVKVRTVEEFEAAKAQLKEAKLKQAAQGMGWFGFCSAGRCGDCSAAEVRMKSCSYGSYSPLTAGQKGWVYLERFASMVKGAMVPEDQIESVAFSTSAEATAEIHEGARRLRAAAALGRDKLLESMQYFVDRLEEKHFTAVSLDKANNTGGVGGVSKDKLVQKTLRDADIVGQLMRELVDDLANNWEREQTRQRQRQLVLAVSRGDLKAATQLIEGGADVNAADGQGVTCVHAAAKGRNLDMVKLLIERKGDLRMQDVQGNSPAHAISLWTDQLTIDLFQALAPTRDILSLANRAGISVFDRFDVWSGTADSNKPYEPADKLAKSLVASMPELLELRRSGSNLVALLPSISEIQTSLIDVKRGAQGARSVQVPVFHSKSLGAASRDVVWIGLALYMPRSLQEQAVKTIAGYLNTQSSTKVYFLSEDIFDAEDQVDGIMTNEQKTAGFMEVIDGLPLKGKYTLIENACGCIAPLVFAKCAQLEHAMFLNPIGWFSEEFVNSAGFMGMMRKVDEHGSIYKNKETEKCLDIFGSFMFTRTSGDVAKARELYRESLQGASSSFFAVSGGLCVDTRAMTGCYSDLPRWGDVPLTLVCGAYSPTLLVQDTIARIQEHAQQGSIRFIPNSKQWWEVEGKVQLDAVASIMLDALQA